MTPTERGRRSDALYYDNVGMQRRRLCDMVANLESDNVELREEIEAAKHDLQVFSMGSVQLEAENAKLRELVAELEKVRKAFCSVNETRDVSCECCPAMWFCDTNPIQRMHELGVGE